MTNSEGESVTSFTEFPVVASCVFTLLDDVIELVVVEKVVVCSFQDGVELTISVWTLSNELTVT